MISLVRIKEFVLLKDFNSSVSVPVHIMETFVKMKVLCYIISFVVPSMGVVMWCNLSSVYHTMCTYWNR